MSLAQWARGCCHYMAFWIRLHIKPRLPSTRVPFVPGALHFPPPPRAPSRTFPWALLPLRPHTHPSITPYIHSPTHTPHPLHPHLVHGCKR